MVERGGGTASYFYANELSRTCVRIVGTWWTRGDSNPWPRECDERERLRRATEYRAMRKREH